MGEKVEGEEWDIKLTSFMQNIRFHQKKENEEIFFDAKLASTDDYVRPSVQTIRTGRLADIRRTYFKC